MAVNRRILASLLVAATLGTSACGPKTVWVKPGASEEDFARDAHDCERDARASAESYGAGLAGGVSAAIDSGGFQRGCLKRRGWVPAEETSEAAPAAAPTPETAPGAPAPQPGTPAPEVPAM